MFTYSISISWMDDDFTSTQTERVTQTSKHVNNVNYYCGFIDASRLFIQLNTRKMNIKQAQSIHYNNSNTCTIQVMLM